MTPRNRFITVALLEMAIVGATFFYLDQISTGAPTWDVAIALIVVYIGSTPFGVLWVFDNVFRRVNPELWLFVVTIGITASCSVHAYLITVLIPRWHKRRIVRR